MNLAITIIGILMVADSLFTLVNFSNVESVLLKYFPNLKIKQLAILEGIVGALIIAIKIFTRTVY